VDDHRAVVEAWPQPQRRADDQQRTQLLRGRDEGGDGGVDGVEHGILHHEVVDGVSGQAELREDGDGDGIVAERAGRVDDRLGVSRRVGDRDGDRAGGDRANPCR
jgi:hypothetical protein